MLSQQGENGERNVRRKPNNYISIGLLKRSWGIYFLRIDTQTQYYRDFGNCGTYTARSGLVLRSYSIGEGVSFSEILDELVVLPRELFPKGKTFVFLPTVDLTKRVVQSLYDYNYHHNPGLTREEYLVLLMPDVSEGSSYCDFCEQPGVDYVYIDPIEEAPVTRKFRFS